MATAQSHTAQRFVVKNANGFYKKSYDSFGGHWTHDESAAATWATAEGAQRMATRQQHYARQFRTGNPDSICVAVIQREVA